MTITFAFQDTFQFVDTMLASFAAEKSSAIATVLGPAITAGLGIGWIMHGVKHWMGSGEEPFMAFIQKTGKMAFILFAAFSAEEYNSLMIQTFQDSPVALASAFAGTPGADATLNGFGVVLDGNIDNVLDITTAFFKQAQWNDLYPLLMGFLVMAVGGIVTIGAGLLILLSKVASSLILSLGPLFICSLLFEWSKNYFTKYIDILIQYGLVGVLAVGANSMILNMFQQTAQQLASLHGMATIYQCAALLITGAMGILVLWQVPSLAAALAGGMSLSTFGVGRKIAGGVGNKLTNKQGRDNQQAAKNQIAIGKHVEQFKKEREQKMPRSEIQRTGT